MWDRELIFSWYVADWITSRWPQEAQIAAQVWKWYKVRSMRFEVVDAVVTHKHGRHGTRGTDQQNNQCRT